ncbi:unnamed protein product [Candida verbasci]|uniref:MYND-type domain-containing protein n=1 Tax=Candida verbasci TaxID=1227364 RepID=A0A9W4TTS9_9ASCO|nr:unnamed protein product [Candida verbasci]
MRDSNYRSISNNKAAVTITTSLYDRRALDVTSDKPLVNSLNYLTYLVSSSAKVRETLSIDGGIERLIEILHECHNCNLLQQQFIDDNSEKKLLIAWKWTLAFQCLVLVGTRGTEQIRQKVVKAGILPIIATVINNYLLLNERTFLHANSSRLSLQSQSETNENLSRAFQDEVTEAMPRPNLQQDGPIQMATAAIEATSISNTFFDCDLPCDDYSNFSLDELFKLIQTPSIRNHQHNINNDVKKKYIIMNLITKLIEEKQMELNGVEEFDMDSNLQFLSDLYARDYEIIKTNNLKIAVRSFTDTGVVIPKDDDIVWSLQLLAYISKYPYLKEVLQNTHLVLDMSIRDKQLKLYLERQMKLKMKKTLAIKLRATIIPKSRIKPPKTYIEKFSPSASNSPQMVTSLNDDTFLNNDKFELVTAEPEKIDEEPEEIESGDEEIDEDTLSDRSLDTIDLNQPDYLSKLHESIEVCENITDDLERQINLYQTDDKLNKLIEVESRKLKTTIINTRKQTKQNLLNKWNYEEYNFFDVDDYNEDKDDSLIEYKKVNLFPLVEKFTFLSGTDMYYWSGVIMRNSCRRNELRGGVRQCGNLECGKWEKYPREFSKCRRCKRTKYCSRDCQMRAWHCHRNWCIPSSSSTSTTTAQSNNDEESQQESS